MVLNNPSESIGPRLQDAADVNLRGSGRSLTFASDVMGTLFGDDNLIRQDYLEALARLQLAGHTGIIVSSNVNSALAEGYEKFFLRESLKSIGLSPDDIKTIQDSHLGRLQSKSDWRKLLGADHIDLVFDDSSVTEGYTKWLATGEYSHHIEPDTPKFKAFIEAVRQNPQQNIWALLKQLQPDLGQNNDARYG